MPAAVGQGGAKINANRRDVGDGQPPALRSCRGLAGGSRRRSVIAGSSACVKSAFTSSTINQAAGMISCAVCFPSVCAQLQEVVRQVQQQTTDMAEGPECTKVTLGEHKEALMANALGHRAPRQPCVCRRSCRRMGPGQDGTGQARVIKACRIRHQRARGQTPSAARQPSYLKQSAMHLMSCHSGEAGQR